MSTRALPSNGKRRGLEATSTAENHFAILALDHIGSMAQMMQPDDPATVTLDQIAVAKFEVARRLHRLASAVLLDPLIGYAAGGIRPDLWDGTGLLLGIEESDYSSIAASPRIIDGWSVERAAAAGAHAIKISFRFDPEGDTGDVERFVRDVVAECDRVDVPLFAEPLGVFRHPAERRRVIVEGARRFSRLGVDVLKLEFPEDVTATTDRRVWAEACGEVDSASAVPWTLLSAGEDLPRFRAMLEIACDAGASGFVAGRAVWRDAVLGSDAGSAWRHAADRLGQLAQTTRERARPWTRDDDRRTAEGGA